MLARHRAERYAPPPVLPFLLVRLSPLLRVAVPSVIVALCASGCARARTSSVTSTPVATPTAASATAHHHHAEGLPPVEIPAGAIYTEADVRFMQGMIAHHAQAVHMSRLAEGRGGSTRVLRFARKIDQSQAGEIRLMQEWLHAHGQFAPDTSSWRTMSMPGMLTTEALDRMAAASGAAFDRQFLTNMITHHEGALAMVRDLFASPRAAQDVDVSVFANDVETVQTAEIGLMRQMLSELE
jgi:uncharacterized protein (DUF305 family)